MNIIRPHIGSIPAMVLSASHSETASFAMNGGGGGSTATYTSSLFGTASWATNSNTASYISTASYANKALSASYAPGSSATTYTSSLFGTASYADKLNPNTDSPLTIGSDTTMIQGSITLRDIINSQDYTIAAGDGELQLTSTTVHVIGDLSVDSAIDATGYISSGVRMTAPSFTGSLKGTASYANSASYAPGSSAATYTSSLYGTASWASNVNTASWATNAQLATQVTINGEANPDTYYVAIVNGSNVEYDNSGLFYYDLSPETLYVPHIVTPSITGSLKGTASYAVNALTASALTVAASSVNATTYLLFQGASAVAVNENTGLSFNPSTQQLSLVAGGFTGSLFGTASYANKALSASYAPSTTAVSASWASASISASYAPGSAAATYTSSLFGTASWATNVVNGGANCTSASWASSSFSSSVESVITSAFITGALAVALVTGAGNGQQLYVMSLSTQLSYDIVGNVLTTTASYANNALSALTASYLNGATILSRESYITSSVAQSTTASINFAGNNYQCLSISSSTYFTGSNYSIGSVVAVKVANSSSLVNMYFPSNWVFIGANAPTAISSSKTGVLSLTSYGTTDSGIIAAWAVQS